MKLRMGNTILELSFLQQYFIAHCLSSVINGVDIRWWVYGNIALNRFALSLGENKACEMDIKISWR